MRRRGCASCCGFRPPRNSQAHPGSRPVDLHSRNRAVAARATGDRRALAQLSSRVATYEEDQKTVQRTVFPTIGQSFSQPDMISMRRQRRLLWPTALPRNFRTGVQGRIPLSFNAFLNDPASQPRSAIIRSAAGKLPGRVAAPVWLLIWPAVMKNFGGRALASVTPCSLVLGPPFVRANSRPRRSSGPPFSPAGLRPFGALSSRSHRP